MAMVQRKFYLPQEMYLELQQVARMTKKSITQVLRECVDEGLKKKKNARKKPTLAEALVKLGKQAKKEGWGKDSKPTPDLSINHNKYFVEAWEENYKKRQQ